MAMRKRHPRLRRLILIVMTVVALLAAWAAAPALLIRPAELARERPETTAYMKLRQKQAKARGVVYRVDQRWVPLGRISRHLRQAVLVSEDANFFGHRGVDWTEARETVRQNWEKRRFARGGSTISMQLARNLYLSPSKNPLRKLQEILLAWRLEKALSKARIFELYLNVVEWGPGIFGAEAAAQRWFHKSAAALSPEEAARLAAVLPSPLRWDPTSRQKVVLKRKATILKRMAARRGE